MHNTLNELKPLEWDVISYWSKVNNQSGFLFSTQILTFLYKIDMEGFKMFQQK